MVQIVVMSKEPALGQVKTRLQPQYSLDFSLELHRKLISHTLSQISPLRTIADISVFGTGNIEGEFWKSIGEKHSIAIFSQVGKHLGERMHNAIAQCSESSIPVIVIGTDCPNLDERYISSAIDLLSKQNDVVLGPAKDGGYVLIALNKAQPALFEGIEWGTSQVLAQTINKVKHFKLAYQMLPTLSDIDRPEDIKSTSIFLGSIGIRI